MAILLNLVKSNVEYNNTVMKFMKTDADMKNVKTMVKMGKRD